MAGQIKQSIYLKYTSSCRTAGWILSLHLMVTSVGKCWHRGFLHHTCIAHVPLYMYMCRYYCTIHIQDMHWMHRGVKCCYCGVFYSIEYDAISRLGIDSPLEYLTRRYCNQTKLLHLETCCVGQLVQTRVEAALEEVQSSNSWVDIMVSPLLLHHILYLCHSPSLTWLRTSTLSLSCLVCFHTSDYI